MAALIRKYSFFVFAFSLSFVFPSHTILGQSTGKSVISFFTTKNDAAHISFVKEANNWFLEKSKLEGFFYDTSSNWENMNSGFLANYQLIIFLDTRPEKLLQRQAFENYMKNGGAWIGFHFAGFALDNSTYPQNWDWYHHDFLGAGQYKGNTWRPVPALLEKQTPHAITSSLPDSFYSSANEWYSWEKDLRDNDSIQILLSIHPASFPLGTGPKPHEIWHKGYYPVAWTNRFYRMCYFNMGHNDIDYESGSNKELSFSFGNKFQDELIMSAVRWMIQK